MQPVLSDEQAKQNIAVNVQALLDAREWNQRDLARAIDESDMRVSFLVRGVKLASAAMLARVAEALETTVDALLAYPKRSPSHRKTSKVA
jgi:transcriptional regulator with XRE-family HTH domain